MNEDAIREAAIRVAKVSKRELRLSMESDAVRSISGRIEPILRALVQATARRCAEIAKQPQGHYSVGMSKLPYWDGEKIALAIRKEFDLGV